MYAVERYESQWVIVTDEITR
ncbi:MAG: hypothetical protein CFH10_00715, partial [Alphaproteobacteria bacterium MarineAlpha4_Bin2]